MDFAKLRSHKKLWIILFFSVGAMILMAVNKNDNRENRSIEEGNCVRITEKEENPYSTETSVGFYLYDIFEANRGSCSGKEWYSDESFQYYEIFDPLQDEHYNMEWEITLLKLQDAIPVADKFNQYHESLFEKEKEEMVKLYEEGTAQYKEGLSPDFSYYSRNLRTEACYSWGSFFTVVDVANVHMSQTGGCSIITANFNKSSGKQYQLDDLFIVKDYKKRLLMKMEAQYQEEIYLVNDWSDCLNEDEVTFLLTFKGLMLIDNFEQRTFLFEWNELEDILCREIINGEKEKEENTQRTPKEMQWLGDQSYDMDNTIYHKNYYDDFVRGRIMEIRYPEIDLKEKLEDYFIINEGIVEGLYPLADMFYDNRTIEMEEEALRELFYEQGYYIYVHNETADNLHIRLIEIQEVDSLSLYPSRIVIQTWDDAFIYVQDITGPIPRKIRSFLTVDNQEEPKMIVHSTGLSLDYVSEEELSFWTFRGTYWVLAPMELDIDTSHAHNTGNLYPDLDRDTLFPVTLYRDGIVYGSSRQNDLAVSVFTYRLGKMEELEKNKRFRLYGIYENQGKTYVDESCYLTFRIK